MFTDKEKDTLTNLPQGSLAQKVLSIFWAFPTGDSRRDDIRRLALDVHDAIARLQAEVAALREFGGHRNYCDLMTAAHVNGYWPDARCTCGFDAAVQQFIEEEP